MIDREFINAAKKGNLKAVQDALSKGADIHVNGNAPLCYASQNGHLKVVQYLISSGADVHADDDYALYWASYRGHLGVVKCLLDHGAFDIDNETIKAQWLARALQNTNLEWLELYLSTQKRSQALALKIMSKNAICGAYALCWSKGDL